MGYTHYFDNFNFKKDYELGTAVKRRDFTDIEWEEIKVIAKEAKVIAKDYNIILSDGNGDNIGFIIDDNRIMFNGYCDPNGGDLSHETFCIDRIRDDRFGFCKTARKPYDLIVMYILLRIKYTSLAKDTFTFSSDGSIGQELVKNNNGGWHNVFEEGIAVFDKYFLQEKIKNNTNKDFRDDLLTMICKDFYNTYYLKQDFNMLLKNVEKRSKPIIVKKETVKKATKAD
jgi:hypothetical protein